MKMDFSGAARAAEFMEKGKSQMKKWFGGSSKYEKACDFFEKAANLFKTEEKWHEAAAAYEQMAVCKEKTNDKYGQSQALAEAAKCMKGVGGKESLSYLQRVIPILAEQGKHAQVARFHMEAAQILQDEEQIDEAIKNYKRAAGLFKVERSQTTANQCLTKVAELLSKEKESFKEAADIYEEIGRACLEQSLLRLNAKKYFYPAVLCHLANKDIVAARENLEKYRNLDHTFDNSREFGLLEKIMTAIDDYDSDAFAQAVFQHDRISKLSPWETTVLLRIKEGIKGNTEKTALAMEAQKEAGGGGGGGGGDAEGEDGPADTGDDLSNLAALA